MREMVEKVVVYDEERVEVVWRYRDELLERNGEGFVGKSLFSEIFKTNKLQK